MPNDVYPEGIKEIGKQSFIFMPNMDLDEIRGILSRIEGISVEYRRIYRTSNSIYTGKIVKEADGSFSLLEANRYSYKNIDSELERCEKLTPEGQPTGLRFKYAEMCIL